MPNELELDHDGAPPDPVSEAPPHRISDATTQVPGVEATATGAVERSNRPATADAATSRRTAQRLRHLAVHAHTDRGAVAVVPGATDDRGDPRVRPHDDLLPLRRLRERRSSGRLLDLRALRVREHLRRRLRGLGTRLAGVPCGHVVVPFSQRVLAEQRRRVQTEGSPTEQRCLLRCRSRLGPSLAGGGLCRLAPRAPSGADTIIPRTSDAPADTRGVVAWALWTPLGTTWGQARARSTTLSKGPIRQGMSHGLPVDNQGPIIGRRPSNWGYRAACRGATRSRPTAAPTALQTGSMAKRGPVRAARQQRRGGASWAERAQRQREQVKAAARTRAPKAGARGVTVRGNVRGR